MKNNDSLPGRLEKIEVKLIRAPKLPREHDKKHLEMLSRSMDGLGQLQNVVLRKLDNGTYRCVCGWGRVKACKKPTILANVQEMDDETELLMTLAENVCRADLKPIEREKAIVEISETFKVSNRKLEKLTGISREWIRKCKKAHEIRDSLDIESQKLASHLPTDILESVGFATPEERGKVINKIVNDDIKHDSKAIKKFIHDLNGADPEEKEKMLTGSDTTKKTESITASNDYKKMFDTVMSINIESYRQLEDTKKEKAKRFLRHSSAVLLNDLHQIGLLQKTDYENILRLLDVTQKEIDRLLSDVDV